MGSFKLKHIRHNLLYYINPQVGTPWAEIIPSADFKVLLQTPDQWANDGKCDVCHKEFSDRSVRLMLDDGWYCPICAKFEVIE